MSFSRDRIQCKKNMIKQPAEQLLTASYIHVPMTCCSQTWPQAILNHDHKHINVKKGVQPRIHHPFMAAHPSFFSIPSLCFRHTLSLLSVCLPFAFGIPEHRSISVSVPGHAFSLCLCSAVLPVFLFESVGDRNSRDRYSGNRGNGGDNDDHSLHI